LERDVIVYQDRGGVQFETVWKEFFVWGRSYASTRSRILSDSRRLLYGLLVPTLPAVLLVRMAARVIQRGRYLKAFLKALPFTTLMTISWSGGELVGYWRLSPVSERTGTSRPAIS